VAERVVKAWPGGHVVIYDRVGIQREISPGQVVRAPADWIDGTDRWVVMHEPSSVHVTVTTERTARELMKAAAADPMVLGGDLCDYCPDRLTCKRCYGPEQCQRAEASGMVDARAPYYQQHSECPQCGAKVRLSPTYGWQCTVCQWTERQVKP
jgi:hypothetical protein